MKSVGIATSNETPAVTGDRGRFVHGAVAIRLVRSSLRLTLEKRCSISPEMQNPGLDSDRASSEPSPDEEHFSDGLTEEVINLLTKVRDLRVVARTSAFVFKTREADVREIGTRLGVATVLEGSVRRSGDELRVTAQLISSRTGFHVWSENYNRRMSEIFQVQDEIAGSTVAWPKPSSSWRRRRLRSRWQA
jgi:TolB-like protein